MKKIFTFMALVAALVFTGCSKDEDSGISGGTPYSGDLFGTWECSGEDDGVSWVDIMTFNSDGSFVAYWSLGDDWCNEKGLFFVKDNVLVLQYMTVEYDYYGESGTKDYLSYIGNYAYIYFYIVDTTSEYIELEIMDKFVEALEVDWDKVDDMIENKDSYMTGETITYYKK